jgi:hypothetical protein
VSCGARASLNGLNVTSCRCKSTRFRMSSCASLILCRVGLQALHDCSQVLFSGCVFDLCGGSSCSGLQFGSSSQSSSSGSNSGSSSQIAQGGSSASDAGGGKCNGAVLKYCIVSTCGHNSGGAAVHVTNGSNVSLQRCSIASSVGDSIRVTLGSMIMMKMCCVYASGSTAVVFSDKSTGQLMNCQLLSACGNGLELLGVLCVLQNPKRYLT